MKRFYLTAAMAVIALLGLAQAASAQRFGGPSNGGLQSLALVRNEAVQKELKLTDEQKEKLAKKVEALRGNPPNVQDPLQRFREMNKKRAEIVKEVLDKKQQKRLEEIQLQRTGAAAMADPDIAKKLKLDDDQKEKMKKILMEDRAGAKPFDRTATQEERQKFITEMRKRVEKRNTALLAVLTPEQKEAFEKMQGEKFEFPQRNGNGGNQ